MNSDSVKDLLVLEAELLDEWRLDEWLQLCTDDVVYWMPAGPHPEEHDHRREVSLAYDDRQRLEERVTRLKSGAAHAQDPASRLVRLVSNVRITDTSDGACKVRSNVAVFEARLSQTHHYAAAVEHELVRQEASWRIRRKKVNLVDSNQFLPNLAFII